MQSLPDLSQLSHAQKDELIGRLFAQLQELATQVQSQQKRIEELQSVGADSKLSHRAD